MKKRVGLGLIGVVLIFLCSCNPLATMHDNTEGTADEAYSLSENVSEGIVTESEGQTDLQQETVTELQTSPLAPTGYPEGEVQRIFLFYRDKLWVPLDEDGSICEEVPGGYSEAATVQNEDNTIIPEKELSAAHLPVGTRIYAKAEDPEHIYVDESPADGSVRRYKKYVVYIENRKFD